MTKSKWIMIYGVFLIVCGVTGYLSNPEKAKTALMSGGLFGSLSIFWGWLASREVSWSMFAAKVTTGFLAVVFTWRSVVTWGKALGGAPEKTFAACLITAMLLASIYLLTILSRNKN